MTLCTLGSASCILHKFQSFQLDSRSSRITDLLGRFSERETISLLLDDDVLVHVEDTVIYKPT